MSLTVTVIERRKASQPPATVVQLAGRLDTAAAPQAERELGTILETQPRTLVLDLARLEFISSAGLRVLFDTRQRVLRNGGDTYFTDPQPAIRKVFEIVKALPEQTVFQSEEELDDYLALLQRRAAEEG